VASLSTTRFEQSPSAGCLCDLKKAAKRSSTTFYQLVAKIGRAAIQSRMLDHAFDIDLESPNWVGFTARGYDRILKRIRTSSCAAEVAECSVCRKPCDYARDGKQKHDVLALEQTNKISNEASRVTWSFAQEVDWNKTASRS